MTKVVGKKKKVGKPLKFSEDDILTTFAEYVIDCNKHKPYPLVLSKAGFLKKLKMSRETYREYKLKPEYVDTIKDIELTIEDAWIQQLTLKGVATGAIFYLKNAFRDHYKDRVETDITSKGEQIHIYIPERK